MVEQNTENVSVIGSNPILGNSFDFGEDIKQAALIIHAKGTEKMQRGYPRLPSETTCPRGLLRL